MFFIMTEKNGEMNYLYDFSSLDGQMFNCLTWTADIMDALDFDTIDEAMDFGKDHVTRAEWSVKVYHIPSELAKQFYEDAH